MEVNSPGFGEMEEPLANGANGFAAGADTGVAGAMSSPSSWKLGGFTGVRVLGLLSNRAFPGTFSVSNGLAFDIECCREERC